MSLLKGRAHNLIEQLSDDEMFDVWTVLSELYYDFYMLKATQAAKQTLKPGDSLTREDALRFLSPL